jgi:molybdopterin converting factor small subunit
MKVRVKLFAVARQRVGNGEVEVELADPNGSGGPTVADLRLALLRQFGALAEVLPHVRMAVNGDYAAESSAIPPGAEVALIPPVSGG